MEDKKEEVKKDEGKEAKPTGGDTDKGDKPEVYKPIDDANLAAKRMEDANKERRELLNKEEELLAKRALGGVADAGSTTKKEETPQEYVEKMRAQGWKVDG